MSGASVAIAMTEPAPAGAAKCLAIGFSSVSSSPSGTSASVS
jgi:hypothetical protein